MLITEPILVAIFDNNPIILQGLKSFFDPQPEYNVVFICQDPADLLHLVSTHKPDLVIMDVIVEGVFGLEKFKEMRDHHPEVVLLCFSNVSSLTILENLYAYGIRAFISKREPLENLRSAIDFVWNTGEPFVPEALAGLIKKVETPIFITRREKSILTHIIAGLPSKQIADQENISNHTVDFHRRNLMKKFGVSNVAELVREGVEFGYGA